MLGYSSYADFAIAHPKGCPKGYRYESAIFDCQAEILSPADVVVVRRKPKINWDWAGFWSNVLPGISAPTPPRVIAEPQSNFPPPPAIPFWKTPLGIALIVAGAAGIIYLARKK